MRFDLASIWKKWIIISILVNDGKTKKNNEKQKKKGFEILIDWLIDWLTSPKPEYIVISVYFGTTPTLLMIIDIEPYIYLYVYMYLLSFPSGSSPQHSPRKVYNH